MNIVINGIAGKMGQRILHCSKDFPVNIIGGVDLKENLEKIENNNLIFTDNIRDFSGKCDVIIDFSSPKALDNLLQFAVSEKIKLVIGTTGYSEKEIEKIKKSSEKIPILFSPNMSIGVNFIFHILPTFVKILKEWDIEILELHHNQKKDAPSGTAKKILEIIKNNLSYSPYLTYGREGNTGKRKKEEIGCFAIRGGDIVGEHTIYFITEGERIELTHKASSRDTFARGALKGALFLKDKSSGLFNTLDMIKEIMEKNK